MTVREVLHTTEDKLKKTMDFLLREFSEIRTGRASPHLVEGMHVDYYGTPTILKQLASISVPDAHMLMIQPWDPKVIPEIEKTILKSNLGITPFNDGKVVKLPVPQLSKERRLELTKVVNKISEEAKISVRTIRRDSKELMEKLEKDKVISEDDKFKAIEELQKLVDKYSAKIEEILKNKDKEILEF
ncbi:MAG: ribosome recycling factor [Candidatus Omnitrophica bacterium]|nr:ribosome recycling factor [Candidatus Omnitrophota bacterium]